MDVCFPCCPEVLDGISLGNYSKNLKTGELFAYYKDESSLPKLFVENSMRIDRIPAILVLCRREDDTWAIIGIILNKESHFIHFYLGTHSDKEQAEKCLGLI